MHYVCTTYALPNKIYIKDKYIIFNIYFTATIEHILHKYVIPKLYSSRDINMGIYKNLKSTLIKVTRIYFNSHSTN